MTTVAPDTPGTFAEVADALAAAGADGVGVAISGAQTKRWAPATAPGDGTPPPRALRTTGLDRILAHDPGDMTASLQAGVPLAAAQAAFADCGQMLSLDPPLGTDDGATIGGIVATGDCGPLAHRHGGPRDLVVGATFALADGTIASSGGTVIKNVAGYDIAKLLCGSFGTLAVILSVNVRLHPRHPMTTVTGRAGEPETLGAAAVDLARMPAELRALDARWEDGAGILLAAIAGEQAAPRAQRLATAMRDAGLDDVQVRDDAEAEWEHQRERQRSAECAVLHVAAAPSALASVLAATEAVDGSLVARAGLGHSHVTVAPERIAQLRVGLPAGAVSTLRDCPPAARAAVADPWGVTPAPTLAVMRAVKQRFDPTHTCNPATFVGGI